jgi:hypothetical protein
MRSPAPTLRLLIVILAAGCLTALRVAAQDGAPIVPNLDTMVVKATVVMVARFVETFPPNVRAPGRTWTFVVEKDLKGDVSDRPQDLIKAPAAKLDAWKTQGHRLLIVNSASESVIDLSAPDLKVLRADMTVLQGAESVIGAAEEAIRTHSGVDGIETFGRTIPAATARILWPNLRVPCVPDNWYSTCPVTLVPVDEALEQWAVDAIQSTQVWDRAEGAGALRHFPSDANIARLKVLLGDPELLANAGGPAYLVRQRAYEALTSIGVRLPAPVVRP